jgi:ABC-2 type transport system ATP-binding protein
VVGAPHPLPHPEPLWRATGLMERFDLSDAAGRRAGTYSGGMTRRLDLAMSLIGEPRILFLDEPTTGLDPRSRRTMWQVIGDLADSGVTVFLTTQYLEEADHLAHRIAVLDHGRLVAQGTPAELKSLVAGGHVRLQFADSVSLEAAARLLGEVPGDRDTLTLRVPSDGSVASLKALLDRLDDRSITVRTLSIHAPDLDDVFFDLTGRPAANAAADGKVTTR